MSNSKNDYEKLVQSFEDHLEALDGDRWHELTAKEVVKLLAESTLGLNGGAVHRATEAQKVIPFQGHHMVPSGDGVFHVLTLVEFHPRATQCDYPRMVPVKSQSKGVNTWQ